MLDYYLINWKNMKTEDDMAAKTIRKHTNIRAAETETMRDVRK